MTRTVFSTLTGQASTHLSTAHALLASAAADRRHPMDQGTLEGVAATHRDLTAALVHLGRTVRSSQPRRDTPPDRLLTELQERARARLWSDPAPTETLASVELADAARCVRAAADLWTTHRTADGAPRSPEASRLRHPSTIGVATRHWTSLVGQCAAMAAELASHGQRLGFEGVADLAGYPKPARVPKDLQPLLLPVARPSLSPAEDVFDAVDDRVDRIHRHVWEVAHQRRMTSTVLRNVAAIGMLLARVAILAEDRTGQAGTPAPSSDSTRPGGASRATVTLGDLERWAAVASAVAPLRTLDPPTSVLQVERLDLARLLERALGGRRTRASQPLADAAVARLIHACLEYRAVAQPCATSVRSLQQDGELYLAGRQLSQELIGRKRDFVNARLGGQLVPAPTVVGRRLEAQLHAISAAPSGADSAA